MTHLDKLRELMDEFYKYTGELPIREITVSGKMFTILLYESLSMMRMNGSTYPERITSLIIAFHDGEVVIRRGEE